MPLHDFVASGINDPQKIRVAIYSNNQIVHVPLLALFAPISDRCSEVENKVLELEKKITILEKK